MDANKRELEQASPKIHNNTLTFPIGVHSRPFAVEMKCQDGKQICRSPLAQPTTKYTHGDPTNR